MLVGEGTQLIRRSARDIFEFVLDFERYRLADLKIGVIHSVKWVGDHGEVHYSGRFRGLSTPSVRQIITVQRFRRIDVRSKPGTAAHLVSPFHGLFTFEALDDGYTRVFHREELRVRPPLRWLVEPFLRSWFELDIVEEVLRLKALLEGTAIG